MKCKRLRQEEQRGRIHQRTAVEVRVLLRISKHFAPQLDTFSRVHRAVGGPRQWDADRQEGQRGAARKQRGECAGCVPEPCKSIRSETLTGTLLEPTQWTLVLTLCRA
jgi:hypothetical protein